MCIGCGLCQSVSGPDVVKVAKVESGYECPVVVGELDHETVDRILDAALRNLIRFRHARRCNRQAAR